MAQTVEDRLSVLENQMKEVIKKVGGVSGNTPPMPLKQATVPVHSAKLGGPKIIGAPQDLSKNKPLVPGAKVTVPASPKPKQGIGHK